MATNKTQIPTTFTEAPASFNVKCYSPDGFDIMLTLRDQDSTQLMDRVSKALKWLKENGFSPTRQYNEPAPPPLFLDDDDPIAREAELDDRRPVQSNGDSEEMFFQAHELVANVSAGKTYWKVKADGGKFGKYGVTVWPEVLEEAIKAGLIPEEELDPRITYQLTGLLAGYIETDKGRKITRLSKAR